MEKYDKNMENWLISNKKFLDIYKYFLENNNIIFMI